MRLRQELSPNTESSSGEIWNGGKSKESYDLLLHGISLCYTWYPDMNLFKFYFILKDSIVINFDYIIEKFLELTKYLDVFWKKI